MLVLASASPRRQELIRLISEDIVIAPSEIDETVPENISAEAAPEF